jgi:hypothetical protein
VKIHVRQAPRTVTSCNCSICRRYGALWAYYQPSSVRIEAQKGGLASYSWRRKIRAYFRCKTCGCVTHYTPRKKWVNPIVAVNASNFELDALRGVRIRKSQARRRQHLDLPVVSEPVWDLGPFGNPLER